VGKRNHGPAFFSRLAGRALPSPVALSAEIKLLDHEDGRDGTEAGSGAYQHA
jgi:hypothetical protein